MKKHNNHYDYETRLELLNDEYKHYLTARHNKFKQETDMYQALFWRFWIIWYIVKYLLYLLLLWSIFYAGYWLSSYYQKDKSIEITAFIEQCIDILPTWWAK